MPKHSVSPKTSPLVISSLWSVVSFSGVKITPTRFYYFKPKTENRQPTTPSHFTLHKKHTAYSIQPTAKNSCICLNIQWVPKPHPTGLQAPSLQFSINNDQLPIPQTQIFLSFHPFRPFLLHTSPFHNPALTSQVLRLTSHVSHLTLHVSKSFLKIWSFSHVVYVSSSFSECLKPHHTGVQAPSSICFYFLFSFFS